MVFHRVTGAPRKVVPVPHVERVGGALFHQRRGIRLLGPGNWALGAAIERFESLSTAGDPVTPRYTVYLEDVMGEDCACGEGSFDTRWHLEQDFSGHRFAPILTGA